MIRFVLWRDHSAYCFKMYWRGQVYRPGQRSRQEEKVDKWAHFMYINTSGAHSNSMRWVFQLFHFTAKEIATWRVRRATWWGNFPYELGKGESQSPRRRLAYLCTEEGKLLQKWRKRGGGKWIYRFGGRKLREFS